MRICNRKWLEMCIISNIYYLSTMVNMIDLSMIRLAVINILSLKWLSIRIRLNSRKWLQWLEMCSTISDRIWWASELRGLMFSPIRILMSLILPTIAKFTLYAARDVILRAQGEARIIQCLNKSLIEIKNNKFKMMHTLIEGKIQTAPRTQI